MIGEGGYLARWGDVATACLVPVSCKFGHADGVALKSRDSILRDERVAAEQKAGPAAEKQGNAILPQATPTTTNCTFSTIVLNVQLSSGVTSCFRCPWDQSGDSGEQRGRGCFAGLVQGGRGAGAG